MAKHVWHRMILLAGLASCSGDGPPSDQIRVELTKAMPGRLTSACGLLGTEELKVRAVKVESVGADGAGIASVDVTNQHTLFGNPPSNCTVRVAFQMQKHGDTWILKGLESIR